LISQSRGLGDVYKRQQNYQVLQHFKQLNNQKGVQARMAYEIVLKY
jgi:hypothetical protein